MMDDNNSQRKLNPEARYLIPEKVLRTFIWIFFAAGVAGMAIPWSREFFIRMIPMNLVACTVVLAVADLTRNRRLYPILAIIFLAGWLAEVAGVNTGALFGAYGYSLHMGPALFGAPLVMGISWAMMLYLTVTVVQGFTMHPFYRTVLTAVLMVVFDFLLEPAATWMKMWFWEGGKVPVFNYMSWFLISFALASLFPVFKIRIRNRLAVSLYTAQLSFLVIMIVFSWIEGILKG